MIKSYIITIFLEEFWFQQWYCTGTNFPSETTIKLGKIYTTTFFRPSQLVSIVSSRLQVLRKEKLMISLLISLCLCLRKISQLWFSELESNRMASLPRSGAREEKAEETTERRKAQNGASLGRSCPYYLGVHALWLGWVVLKNHCTWDA